MRYLAKKGDGSVAIFYVLGGSIESIMNEYGNMFISYRQIDESVVPDREFRNAWRDELPGDQIDVCLTTAKQIKLDEMRVKRSQKLDALDKEALIALSKNDSAALAVIENKKNVLRDCTNDLKALVVSGYNDNAALAQIRMLAVVPEV